MTMTFSNGLIKEGLIRLASDSTELIQSSLILFEAQKAALGAEYSTKVGVAAFNGDSIIAYSHNRIAEGLRHTPQTLYRSNWPDRDIHGEIYGIMNCARQGLSTAGSVFAVSEPCCEACARALSKAGVKQVVYSLESVDHRTEWHPGGAGQNNHDHVVEDISLRHALEIFRNAGVEVVGIKPFAEKHPNANFARTAEQAKVLIDSICPDLRRKDLPPLGSRIESNSPGNPAWIDYPLVRSLIAYAREGVETDGAGIVVRERIECRQANALIVAGIRHVIVMQSDHVCPELTCTDYEMQTASGLLREAGIRVDRVTDAGIRPICDRYLVGCKGEMIPASELVAHLGQPPRGPAAPAGDTLSAPAA